MGVYVTKDGQRIVAKTVGEIPALTPGHHWQNKQPLGRLVIWHEVPGELTASDPGRPTLFGYDEAEFMAKQYKH